MKRTRSGPLSTSFASISLQRAVLSPGRRDQAIVLRYTRPDDRHLTLEGVVGAQLCTIGLEVLEASTCGS
jgi:hypothetical protein